MKRLLVVAAFVVGLVMPACGQDFGAGKAAYDRGDYAAALREWKPLAEQGDANAQNNFGSMYYYGLGLPRDYIQAVAWYRRAAEQGDAFAQFHLGAMYGEGRGVPRDYVQSYKWSSLAAAQGNETASKYRDITAERMNREQIDEAERLAREWKPKPE